MLEAQLFDCVEVTEPSADRLDPELPGENYFRRVNGIPVLSRAEQNELIERWQSFKDEKARERVILAHLRIPPSIARKAARGFEPNKRSLATAALVTAWKGHRALIEELIAEGNLALVESVDTFNTDRGFAFATYAGRCIWNAVRSRLRSFSSVVDRPKGKRTPSDIHLNPLLPDMQSPEDYCGGQARSVTPSDDDLRSEGDQLPGKFQRLRPEPPPDYVTLLDRFASQIPRDLARVINLRRGGLNHAEVAEELGISTPTAWRLEQAAHEQMRNLWSNTQSSFRAARVAG